MEFTCIAVVMHYQKQGSRTTAVSKGIYADSCKICLKAMVFFLWRAHQEEAPTTQLRQACEKNAFKRPLLNGGFEPTL